MEEIRIEYEALEFSDYPAETPVRYNDQLFSGIAVEENDLNYFEYKYRNGIQNGRSFGINKKSGELIFQEIFDNGIPNGKFLNVLPSKRIRINELYDKGVLIKKTVHSLKDVLLLEFNKSNNTEIEYDDNGKIIKERVDKIESYFFGSRELCFAKRFDYDKTKEKYNFEFKQELILKNIDKLNSKYFWYPIRWFMDQLLIDNNYYSMNFLHKLIEHDDQYFKSEAAYFLGELGVKQSIPYLQKEINNMSKPWIERRFDFGGHGNSFTTGQRANDAIRKIKKKNSIWYMFFKAAKKN